MEGKASFTVTGSLEVDGKSVDAAKVIIATDAHPHLPSIPGTDQVSYLTSTTAQQQDQLPKNLLVIGAGYIGVEIARIFARAGVEVTMVSRRGLLPKMEPETGETLTQYFEDEGVVCKRITNYTLIESNENGVRLHAASDQDELILDAEKILIATVRNPNTDSLNLQAAGIETRSNHGIGVDAHMQTSRADVYAAGDVTGEDLSGTLLMFSRSHNRHDCLHALARDITIRGGALNHFRVNT